MLLLASHREGRREVPLVCVCRKSLQVLQGAKELFYRGKKLRIATALQPFN
jgi:hypothetical protein